MLDVQCAEIWRSQPSQHIDVARTLRNCRFGVLEDVAQPSPCFKKIGSFNTWSVPFSKLMVATGSSKTLRRFVKSLSFANPQVKTIQQPCCKRCRF